MPSPFDYASDPVPSVPGVAVEDIIRMILNLNKTLPQQQEDEVIIGLKFSPLIDLHDTTVVTGGVLFTFPEFDSHQAGEIGYRKVIPETVHSDPNIYDFSNFTNVRFNIPFTDEGTQFLGGALLTSTGEFLKIDNNSQFDFTDEIILSCWAFLKPSVVGSRLLIDKNSSTAYSLLIDTALLTFEGAIGASSYSLTSTIATEGWHHIVATAKSGIQSLYVDNVLVDSDTLTGALGINSNNIGIYASSTGTTSLAADEGLAWVSIINGFADSAWVADDFIGIRDVSDMDEVVCFPLMSDSRAQPPMTSGLFVSGT